MLKLNTTEIGKLEHLSKDVAVIEALKKLFLIAFLKPKETDVHLLAASRTAIDLLDKAFKNLEVLKGQDKVVGEEKNYL